jgi:NADH:ubiquinone oxidoreductase subunit K
MVIFTCPIVLSTTVSKYDCLSFHCGLAEQSHPLVFSNLLVIVGAVGFMFSKKNIFFLLLCTELLFLGVSLNFIFCSVYTANAVGQLFALIIFVVVAAEASVGLSIMVLVARTKPTSGFRGLRLLRG